MSYNYAFDINVHNTYIIRVKHNLNSENLAKRCVDSCNRVNQQHTIFDAVDGTNGTLIIPRESFHPSLNLLKLTNPTLTKAEQACLLSHFLLWVKCVELDKPIVILEHDAVMLNPYIVHPFFNTISYLGCAEQVLQGWQPQFPLPPHGQLNENFRFLLRSHAYAIDPMIARQMVAKLIKYGMFVSADVFMRIDEFAIIQHGVFAFDAPAETTIPGRDPAESPEVFKYRSLMLCD